MQNLEKEVLRLNFATPANSPAEAEFDVTPRNVSLDEVSKQLDTWLQLTPRKRGTKRSRPSRRRKSFHQD